MDQDEAQLFLDAQDSVWDDVRAELAAGRKRTHWMWFVFPQLAMLGQSPTSQLFGLHDLDEAEGYLAHPQLRDRLTEAMDLVLRHEGRSAEEILGGIDAQKLRSSMTLFAAAKDAPRQCAAVLDAFYDGRRCEQTLEEIGGA